MQMAIQVRTKQLPNGSCRCWLLTPNAEIAEPSPTHVRGRINIAKVDIDRFAQRLFDAGKVERSKRIPFCHDHERGGAFGVMIGVLTVLTRRNLT